MRYWILALALQLWTSTPHDAATLLEGNWQSCLIDGNYEERIFDYCPVGKCRWSFHMGPDDEFALFPYRAASEDAPDPHDTKENLLFPAYHAGDVLTWRGKRNWTAYAGGMRLWISVVEAGGSREECKSWYVKIARVKP